jgi:hypothetical protein
MFSDTDVFPRLVDDPEQAMLFGGSIAKRNVNFALLKRRRIALVVDTHSQLLGSQFSHDFDFRART